MNAEQCAIVNQELARAITALCALQDTFAKVPFKGQHKGSLIVASEPIRLALGVEKVAGLHSRNFAAKADESFSSPDYVGKVAAVFDNLQVQAFKFNRTSVPRTADGSFDAASFLDLLRVEVRDAAHGHGKRLKVLEAHKTLLLPSPRVLMHHSIWSYRWNRIIRPQQLPHCHVRSSSRACRRVER